MVTNSGHYAIPLTKSLSLLNQFESHNKVNFTLTLIDSPNIHKQAVKLHTQFAHPSSERLIKLLKSAGPQWCNNKPLIDEIKKVTESCKTCTVFKKPPARPVVGLPMATDFNGCVAMDLKFFHGHIILHLVDHASRLSAGCRLSSKNPNVILKGMFSSWLKHPGPPTKFLTDNGGEFMNSEFLDLCEQMNITVKTTAAESPWSNGLVERHNLVLRERS